MDFSKEAVLINTINNDKKEYLQEIFKQTNISLDLFERVKKVNVMIDEKLTQIINNDIIDYKDLSNFINILIKEKLYFNQISPSINYFKGRFDVVKANTKLKTISDSYDDGVIEIKGTTSDYIVIKMEQLNAYYNIIKDILQTVKNTKDSLDTTIIALQSQLKSVTFEYLNSGK